MSSIQQAAIQIGNPFMALLLRSPLHRLASSSMMLITFTGRKTGSIYTTPVNYLQDGDCLLTISRRDRHWWRNLRGGAPVKLWFQGRQVNAWAEVSEEDTGVIARLQRILKIRPQTAGFIGVTLDASGQPAPDSLTQAARARVVVLTRFSKAAA